MGLQPCRQIWPCPLTALAALLWVFIPGVVQGSTQPAESDASSLRAIAVSFKLDPLLMGGTYGGELWVSPPTYTSALRGGKEAIVEAKVQGIDAKGRPVSITPQWTAADPEMVTVTPGENHVFRITVKGPGESNLTVASQGVSKELVVKAKKLGQAIQVEITQAAAKELSRPAAATPGTGATTATPSQHPADGTKPSEVPAARAPQDASALPDEKAKESYALGIAMGTRLKRQFPDVQPDVVSRGVRDALAGNETLVSEAEIKSALVKLSSEARTKQAEALKDFAEKNKKDGEAFLAANKAKEGVVTLDSGLQYKVLKAGEGKKPTAADTVVCHYRGTLVDGTEFDSSYNRGKPATFALGRVIKGWNEALQLMPAGSKWQIVVPSSLAYGGKGAGGKIGPNATLVFEVELLSVSDKAQAGQSAGSRAPQSVARNRRTVP